MRRSPIVKVRGFTLVELMVVLVIIAVLVAIAIPIYNATMNTAKEATCKDNLRAIDGALQQWHVADTQSHTWDKIHSVDDLVYAGYLKDPPVEPLGGHYTIPEVYGPKYASCDMGHVYP